MSRLDPLFLTPCFLFVSVVSVLGLEGVTEFEGVSSLALGIVPSVSVTGSGISVVTGGVSGEEVLDTPASCAYACGTEVTKKTTSRKVLIALKTMLEIVFFTL
ncbi:MAG TPA: hypothetical protein VEA59_05075 [Patescibacteria group bacterium]|nr:hypothetical protein [Patescibacteria group bacterium]